MSKNTRWALALVGLVIIIVGAVVIGTGKDNTDAVQEPKSESTTQTGATQSTPVTPQTGTTGSTNSAGPGTDSGGNNSGGASPEEPGQGSGGASPNDTNGNDSSGGAKAEIGVVSPVLAAGKVRTVVADKGETVMIRGVSTVGGEMHIHGYNREVPLRSGEIARVKFKAKIDGAFPIEFHLPQGDVRVGTLRVNP